MTKRKARAVTPPVSAASSQKPAPSQRASKAMAKAIGNFAARPVRVSIEWDKSSDGTVYAAAPHSERIGHNIQLTAAFGSTSNAFLSAQIGHLDEATRSRHTERGQSDIELNAAIALVEAVGPEDELEAALAVQMAGCHALAMEMLGRAKTTERNDHVELYGNMAIKLQRTFTAQIEALARMRGKGQQTVRVEHVTVHPGAQAIVGDVHHHAAGGGGANSIIEDQSHATRQTEERPAMLSSNPQSNGVPITGHAERAMSPARRSVSGRAPRKSARAQARILEPGDDRDPTAHPADAGDAS